MLTITLLIAIVTLIIIDVPFLIFILQEYQKYWPNKIGFNLKMILSMFVVYSLLACSLLFITLNSANPYINAALMGATIYGVYSFTIYALVPDWPIWLAGLETLWGAAMMTIATVVLKLVF